MAVVIAGCATGGRATDATADVNGTWRGLWQSRPGGASGSMEMVLFQTGASVTGTLQTTAEQASYSGPLVGTVSGSAFSFRQPGGAAAGNLMVKDNEMTGIVQFSVSTTVKLQRAAR